MKFRLLLAGLLLSAAPLFAQTTTDRIDGLSASVAIKAPVKAVSTVNLTLSGLQTVGGVVLAEGDRVLVKDQSTTTQNGIYNASSSGWARAKDFDGNRDAVRGTLVVTDGVSTASIFYRLVTSDPVIGTSALLFTQAIETTSPYPRTAAEIAASVTPSDYSYQSDLTGIIPTARYGAAGNGSTNDYTAINSAFLVAAAAGGGNVQILCGKTYSIGTSLTIPEKTRLMSNCEHAQPDEIAGVIKPTNAVSIGIDDSGANRRGIAIENITVDMSAMPNGSTGVLFSGVHQYEIKKLGIYGLPDATSIGLHLRGDAASGFGTLYGRVTDLNISTNALDRGIGVVCETVGSERCNAVLFENARVAHLTTGWKFIGTGSGILCLNCNSESHAGNGVEVTSTISGSSVRWIGGEVNGNGGWGFTGSGGRVLTDATMGTNSSGDIDTATLSVGCRLVLASGPSFETDGCHLRTDKGLIVGSANQTIVAADTILADGGKKRLTAATPIVVSSNPQIADGTSNQIETLVGTSNTNTITLPDSNGLRLRNQITLGLADSITLMYDSGGTNDWIELARSLNASTVQNFTSTDATPSVLGGEFFETAGTTTITDFDDGVVGQCIRVKANASITVADNAAVVLNGSGDYGMGVTDTLTLCMFDDQVWSEVARSNN